MDQTQPELEANVERLKRDLDAAREFLGRDLKTASERVLTLELENQQVRRRAVAAEAECARLRKGLTQLLDWIRKYAPVADLERACQFVAKLLADPTGAKE